MPTLLNEAGNLSAHLGESALTLAAMAVIFVGLAYATKRELFVQHARRAWPETRTNLLFWLFDTLLILPFIAVPAYLFAAVLPRLPMPGTSVAAVVVMAVVIGDLVGYWRHRLQHSRWLWPGHAVHHSDQEMTWLTLARFHPLDRLSTVTIDTLALVVLGFPPYAVVANGMIRNWYGHFEHADLPWHFGGLGKLFISPVSHRWHHSLDTPGKNFGVIFSIWDRAFGTYHGEASAPTALGIAGRRRGFLGEMLRPLKRSEYGSVEAPDIRRMR